MSAQPAQTASKSGETARSALAGGLRFAAVPVLSLAFVILLVGLLNYYKFQTTFQGVAERRISLMLDRAKSSLESAIDLGLRLEDVAVAQSILGSLTLQEWRAEDAFIFESDEGRILFALDPEDVGRKVDPELMEIVHYHSAGWWRVPRNGTVTLGARIDSAYEKGIGSIALTYSLADMHSGAGALLRQLGTAMSVTFVTFALLALLGLYFLSREYRRTAGNINLALDDPERITQLPDEIRQDLLRFREVTAQADTELAELEELARTATERQS